MISFVTKAPPSRRTLVFGSTMHVWSDLFFALLVPLLPLIREDMGLSFTEVGALRSVFSGASAILQVPAGFAAESMGEFWLLIAGNVWVAVGLVAMALSPVFWALIAASGIGGLGGGTQHPLASSMVSRAYDDRGRATAVGTVNFAGDLGKMVAPLVAGLFAGGWAHAISQFVVGRFTGGIGGAISRFVSTIFSAGIFALGWRGTMAAVGIAGLAFMFVSAFTRRAVDVVEPASRLAARTAASNVSNASGSPASQRGEAKPRIGAFATLSAVGALDAATRTSALVFLPFVMDANDMSAGQVSAMLFLLFGGGAAGKFVCGWLGDRMSAISLIWATKGLTALGLVVAIMLPPPAFTLLIAPLAILIGIGLNGTSSVLYATVANFVPPSKRARYYGWFYTTNEIGTVVAPLAYGLLADALSLNFTMIAMGAATAAILPASLTMRRHLRQAGF